MMHGHHWFEIFFVMFCLHNLCDYPLQGPFLSEAKNWHTKLGEQFWPYAMTAHTSIHALAVWAVTGSVLLGVLEMISHFFIDLLKCDQSINLAQDQALHMICKVLWLGLMLFFGTALP